MSAAYKLPDNDPRIIAWKHFQETDEFKNACKWALTEEHLVGSLWAVFIAGHTNIPIDMLLYCPHCGELHVDEPNAEKGWDNPPHRSHECQLCGWVWRPADVPTNGVAAIQTKGKLDKPARPAFYYSAKDFEDALESVGSPRAFQGE